MKRISNLLFVFIFQKYAVAQQSQFDFNQVKPKWYATTFVGGTLVNKAFHAHTNHGYTYGSGAEAVFVNGLFARFVFLTTLLPFDNSRSQDGLLIKNKGSRLLTGGYVDIGYRLQEKKLQPYIYAGTGVTGIISPQTMFNLADNSIATASKTNIYAQLHAGAGVEWHTKFKFIPFLEARYFALPQQTTLFNTKLSGFNITLGFKGSLKSKKLSGN